MGKEKVISREYKVVLKAVDFAGDETVLLRKALEFWKSFSQAVSSLATTEGNLDTIDKKREIRFMDTKDSQLHNNFYIFRERKDSSDDKTEITLKFRHPDRYASQDHDMSPRKKEKGKIKFEEDIKAPFQILYSFSSGIQPSPPVQKIKDIINLYPGLATVFKKKQLKEDLAQVNQKIIHEIVITGGWITIPGDTDVMAEAALIIWYEEEAFLTNPVIAEFSFRYGNEKGKYSGKTAQAAFALFTHLQKELKNQIDTDNATKTGFVYGDR